MATRTVTCLFSDIEGSTRLELGLGTTRYRELLERHQALLRAAWSAHDGAEQSTEGDSFFVLFEAPTAAVAAAADAQRALAQEPWPPEARIRVRIGLHTGEVDTTAAGGVIGHAINRAARITGAAHGGQVLLSDATRALVMGTLPAGVALRDLGEHRLKDLPEPERLAQLVIDGLPDDFPAPRTLGSGAGLPRPLTTFVGRDHEVAEASALLLEHRLLSLTGPGGTGKTRLSLAVAAAVADAFPDGTWFVALDTVREAPLVAPTIARALGIADSASRTAVELIAERLATGRALLVLDNLEQVVAAGPDIGAILRACPSVHALVTTRIPLHIAGEQEYPVPGLPSPPDPERLTGRQRLDLAPESRAPTAATLEGYEAARLFVIRARAARPGWSPSDEEAPAIAAIVARLQGMPLAIELAAARMRLLTPAAIRDRLDRQLGALGAGPRDLPERQQTLHGAIAWSYDLLDADRAAFLDRLSVFRGGFDLSMAAAIADEDEDAVVDRLGDLVDQSLVRLDPDGDPDGAPRFTLLETIREFAGQRLAGSGEQPRVAQRHADLYLALAEAAAPHLSGREQRVWLDRLEREHDNLRAALEHLITAPDPEQAVRLAFALWRFWQQRGYLNEARARLERMALRQDDFSPELAAMFAETIGGIAYWQSDMAATQRWYDEALRLQEQHGDPRGIANARYNRAYADMIEVMRGDPDPALVDGMRGMLEDALATYRDLGDAGGEGNLVWALGSLAYFTADAAAAEAWYRRSLTLHQAAGDRSMEAWSLHMLALSQAGQRSWTAALDTARQALRHFHDAGDVSGVTLVLDDIAIVALGMGDVIRAGRLWGAARHLQHSTGTALADYIDQQQAMYGVPTPKDAIPADRLTTLADEGAAMPLRAVVAYALGTSDADAPPAPPAAPEAPAPPEPPAPPAPPQDR